MNERLKEHAEQAGEYAAQNATGDWEVGPNYQDLFNKKFAELIVRQCADIADSIGEHGYIASEEILEQFGVK